MKIKSWFNYSALMFVKLLKYGIYPIKEQWIGRKADWDRVHLIIILNHTSLFEFLYGSVLPNKFLKKCSKNLIVPVADTTLKKPFIGRLLKCLIPEAAPLTRKRDSSWAEFCQQLNPDKMLIIMPEGRMKRTTGLDKEGMKMKCRTGIADIIEVFKDRQMLLVYSPGLHHVCPPGKLLPRPFKQLSVKLQAFEVDDFIANCTSNQGEIDSVFMAGLLDKLRDENTTINTV